MSATATLPAPVAAPTPGATVNGLHRWKWTREQYYKLGELGFFQDKRVELIFGEIIEMSPINWPHVVGCRKTAELMERVFAGIGWVGRAEPIALGDSDPQPDVAVFAGRFEEYTDHPKTALLIVEVSHTTFDTDATIKAELYATAKILDYWVLDLDNRQLHVFRDPVELPTGLGANAYRKHVTLAETDTASPLAAPTATILVRELLP
ncbi:MAG: Uma2 family endonuclease [Planctomycetaceae bacterium]|nr:Uma2 family endonuclease [Planctomycetaceae bacterium]